MVGYPIGGDNACVTVGVVSRIDMQRYNVPGIRKGRGCGGFVVGGEGVG